MQKLVLSAFLVLLLFPFSQGYSQEYSDTAPTLSVSLNSETPFVYKDSEGHTVVVGAVTNKDSLTPVTNVQIQVSFFDDFDLVALEIFGRGGRGPHHFLYPSDTQTGRAT